jgi:hypothetical protein
MTSSVSTSVLNTVNTSAYNHTNVSSTTAPSQSTTYPVMLPPHHLVNQNPLAPIAVTNSFENFYTGNPPTGLLAANSAYPNVLNKGSSSTVHSQSTQGRPQPKSNAPTNNQQQQQQQQLQLVHQSQQQQQHHQQHIMHQIMGHVNQVQSPGSGNAVVNAVTHSMNTPLLSYGHPPGAHNSHGGHATYSSYPTAGGMSYGGLGAQGYRPNAQVPLLSRPNTYIPPTHQGQMMNNPLAMKQQQDMRNHVGVGHNSLRQKNSGGVLQNQNTPKRSNQNRSTSSSASSSSTLSTGCVPPSSQSQNSCKGDESNDISDRTNHVLTVSANPSKNRDDNRGRIYHHPNSIYSNGPGMLERNNTSYGSAQLSNSNTNVGNSGGIVTPSNNPGSPIADKTIVLKCSM